MRFFVRDGKRSAKKAFLIVMSIMALVAQPLYGVVASRVAQAAAPTVTPTTLGGWVSAVNDGATNSFVVDGTAPSGTGALQIKTANNNNSRARFSKSVDVKLSDVTDISFVSKLISGPAGSANASFRLGIDNDGNGTQDQSVVYETYYNFDATNTSNDGTWQTWNVKDGKFWGSWNGGGAYATNTLLGAIPGITANARITSISLGMGTYNPNWTALVDSVGFNGDTYSFDPAPYTPTAPPTKPALGGEVIFDSVPNTLPSNFPSIGFQATQTRSVGDKITFAGTSRDLKSAAVTLSSWACESGEWTGGCITTPGATFTHPITLNLYNVAGDGTKGSLIGTKTQTFTIPYRPSNDPSCGATQWRDTSGTCFNGLNHVITFDMTGVTVPNDVIYEVAYNTGSYGSPAVGVTGPYDALNVSLNTAAPIVGTDQNAGEIFWNSTYGGRALGLTATTGYAASGNPAVIFTAVPLAAPANLRYESPARACGTLTNINYSKPTWDAVPGAVSYDYRALFNGSVVFNANYATPHHPGGAFGGGQNGVWAFQVRSVFPGGATSSWSDSCEITLDTVAPTTPTITNPTNEQWFSTSPILNKWLAASDLNGIANYQVEYIYDDGHTFTGGPYRDVPGTQTQRSHSPSIGEQGGVTIRVRAIDNAGNIGAWSAPVHYSYDATVPEVGLTAPTGTTNANSVEVKGWATDANMRYYACYITTNQPIYAFGTNWSTGQEPKDAGNSLADSACVTTWTSVNVGDSSNPVALGNFDIADLPDGTYTIHMHAHDLAGNQNEATMEFTIDRTAPTISSIIYNASPSGKQVFTDGYTNEKNFVFHLVSGDGTTRYQLKYWNDIAGSGFNGESHAWSPADISATGHMATLGEYTDLFTQEEGVHYFSFSACDAAGNCSSYSDPFVVTYDNTAPVVTVNSIDDIQLPTNTQTITGTVADANTVKGVEVSTDGGATWQSATTVDGTNWTYDATGLSVETYTVVARATDEAGNTSSDDTSSPADYWTTFTVTGNTGTGSNGVSQTSTNQFAAPGSTNASVLNANNNGNATTDTTPTTDEATDTDVLAATTTDSNKDGDTDGQVLAAEDTKGNWSVVNLVLAVVTIILSLGALLGLARKKDGTAARIMTLIPVAIAVTAFLMIENWTASMIWLNWWTVLYAVVLAVQVAIVSGLKNSAE